MFDKKSLKILVNKIPPSVGTTLSRLDYGFRLGFQYNNYKRIAGEQVSPEEVFVRFYKLISRAQTEIPFYREFYRQHSFHFTDLHRFEDIQKVPVLTKADLQNFPLAQRVIPGAYGIKSNTGGTTGQPLEFLLDSNAYAREWGHMHHIWMKLNYRTNALKLTIRGNDLGGLPIKYCFNQNEFQVNAYCPINQVIEHLHQLLVKYKIEFIHGYPSAIYDLIKYCLSTEPGLINKLRANLKGIFYSSEYPSPAYRSVIENALLVPSISWYGHSEMAVLAYEADEPYSYKVLQTYGFAESVSVGDKNHLIGTTLENAICPLIRYDTGDIIKPLKVINGVLDTFSVSEGRVGEFVIDQHHRNISLTALIFGRHHEIFGVARFVQVYQAMPGIVHLIVVTDHQIDNVQRYFDLSNVAIDFKFHFRDAPIKTRSGKISLLIKDFYETSNSNS